jgi:dUTP pyrophosphatase
MNTLKVKKFSNFPENLEISIPTEDVGIDLYAAESVFICNGYSTRVSTGIAMQPPKGFWLMVKDRSSKALSYETNAGIIDQGYTGEILVSLRVTNGDQFNTSDVYKIDPKTRLVGTGISGYFIKKGDKIAQAIILRNFNNDFALEEVEELNQTQREDKGFGSTGV